VIATIRNLLGFTLFICGLVLMVTGSYVGRQNTEKLLEVIRDGWVRG
jgi:hypothetical protein